MLYNSKKTIEALLNTPEKIEKDELDELVHAVGIIEKVYLERDLENLNVVAVEKSVTYQKLFEGTADLVGEIRKNSSFYPKDYWGKKIIVDWKSKDTGFTDLTKWKKTYMDSWQWRLYSFAENADCFEYRGISRATGETKNLTLKVKENNHDNCLNYLKNSQRLITQLSESYVWPRHKPFACHAYNRECPFYKECKEDIVDPSLVGLIQIKPLHYSDLEVFYMCPERYRLLTKVSEKYNNRMGDSESSRYTRFGAALHRGVAYIYTKTYNL